jgi:hypothetical protein
MSINTMFYWTILRNPVKMLYTWLYIKNYLFCNPMERFLLVCDANYGNFVGPI